MSYGCKNRPELKTTVVAQDGWYQDGYTRTPRMVALPDPMQKECQYSKDDRYDDAGCVGCCHKAEPIFARTRVLNQGNT